ncbi:cytochrome bd-I ubiquinol oxidase subunit 1 apoprotein [Rhodobacter aestuarii]|uniref:Cytochrome bd-I ubiquinol oxidase subunit 1 apoprotein n=1 Tax=Rhodobacter aestuarii TaxID=453582 RepID=A0A1N7JM24_9RHOB|nr:MULTISPECIES: cytochrome ubiquinol oxidase subunit I [Rhodobacter]PTV96076.1 cytochrome bd-I ubiquinol oxidase subunit 1 apoprotein [Rhodobacter aestuarii]SIS50412.1 cytochrome bd-I ubiquinol oxidase subunit 1 apoprotein [Rhodobacter aestuarii]SOC09887.1 cytochrome bd-I ubiquinol oxidase subunit 1 apoprotein [Rhodobacter sp. JA431]
MEFGLVELSRLQFAATAMYHFLFVPLTLGLSIMLATMETVYVMTRRPIWRQMTKFWGTLFGINFVLGVSTGITMEFQFGMNWSYYSNYVGDIFGAPLAIEGLMAFFLEATFVGLWFFGWEKLRPRAHMFVGWCVAIGSNFSALWILIANGWMQNPVGAEFNPMTMRMELVDFYAVLFNPVAQAKFVHTVSAGYVTAAIFVVGVSSWYLLRGRHIELARRSIAVASAFGLAASLSVIVLGDESGYEATHNQKMKLAAIEGMWETEEAPASFNLFGIPDQEARETKYAIKIPYVMGLIGTRSLTEEMPGIKELVEGAEVRIRDGLIAYDALMQIRANKGDVAPEVTAAFEAHSDDLGYAMLLSSMVEDPMTATDEQIEAAAWKTVPGVAPMFWTFRLMVGFGFFMLALLTYMFYVTNFRGGNYPQLALKTAVFIIPMPWLAAEMGWFVAEFGRQPWTVDGLLPTALSASHLSVWDLAVTLGGFVALYTTLLIIEMKLMLAAIRKGPVQDVEVVAAWNAKHAPVAAQPAE